MSQQKSYSSDDDTTPKREEFGLDYGLGIGSTYEGGSILGQNTLGVTGVPQFTYTTNIIGDPWPITATVVNEYTSLTIPAFWSGVRFLAETLAGLPFDIIQKQRNGTTQHDGNHPLDWMLNNEVNGLSTPFVLFETLYQHAIVWGNGYAWIARDNSGKPVGIYNILPDRVQPFRIEDSNGVMQQWYALGINNRVSPVPIPASDVIHVPGLGFDGMRGYPVVQLMAAALRVGKSAEAFGDRFFANGGHLGGVISTPNKLTPEQIETMRSQISTGHTGVANAHRWMVLQGGAEAKTLALPPDSAQYLETRRFAVLDIARILRVPPHVLYDLDRATWNNIEQMGIDLVKYSLNAWIIKTEQEINRKLFSPTERRAGYFVKLNVDALQRGDHAQQIDSATKRLASGVSSINEERALVDKPSIGPDGDVHYVPAQWQSAERAATAPAVGIPNTPPVPPQASNASQSAPVKAIAHEPVSVEKFSHLVADAAERVSTKTEKACTAARTKFSNDGDGWVRWGNVFTHEQMGYVLDAVGPLLNTMAAVGHELDVEATAGAISENYGKALRHHFSALARGEPTESPDLAAIITKSLTKAGE